MSVINCLGSKCDETDKLTRECLKEESIEPSCY